MKNNRYILKDTELQICENLEEWAMWMGASNHRIAHDEIGNTSVSTAFIGVTSSEVDGLPPLFETMIFPSNLVQRYPTYQKALEGHSKIVCDVNGAKIIK